MDYKKIYLKKAGMLAMRLDGFNQHLYSSEKLSERSMEAETGAKYKRPGASESHKSEIEHSGGEIGYDGFKDPRSNEEGKMTASEFFINEQTKEIEGINFNKDGKFCCSYMGGSYKDIKEFNKQDCADRSMGQGDSFGIDLSRNTNEPSGPQHGGTHTR